MSQPQPARSGCALALGVLLVAAGSLLLASSLLGFSLGGLWRVILSSFSLYWPALLIVWGAYKLYQRIAHPESARVGAGEILLLIFVVCVGLTVHFTRRLVTGLPVRVSLDDVIESIDSDLSFGPAYTYSEKQRFDLPAGRPLVVKNTRGSIDVVGWDEPELEVEARKRIYRDSEEKAAEMARAMHMRLDVPQEGPAQLYMEAGSKSRLVEVDLEIRVPRRTPLTLSNQRGPLRVSGLRAPVELASSNDFIEVRDVKGSLSVTGRRGPVRVEHIEGDVEARNRYGALTIKDVRGNLIGETSNDVLFVEKVSGTARLMNRNSRIRVSRVEGDLTVEAAHTEVFVEDIGATAFVETSYRPVFVKAVRGRVSVQAQSSEVEIRQVKGSVDASTVYRSVTLAGIEGGARVTASKGSVRLDGVGGPIQVESSYNPVTIRDFHSSLNVRAKHAPLTIATGALGGELELFTSYSDVELTLPAGASFRLRAKVKGGKVACDFRRPDWEQVTREEVTELSGTAGPGAVPVTIDTSYGDIRIKESSSP